MLIDVFDALPLILKRAGRGTKLLIPAVLAILFALRDYHRREDYPTRTSYTGHSRDHGISRRVDY